MINFRGEELEKAKGIDYWKIRFGFRYLPEYLARNIGDFLSNEGSIQRSQFQ